MSSEATQSSFAYARAKRIFGLVRSLKERLAYDLMSDAATHKGALKTMSALGRRELEALSVKEVRRRLAGAAAALRVHGQGVRGDALETLWERLQELPVPGGASGLF